MLLFPSEADHKIQIFQETDQPINHIPNQNRQRKERK